MEVLQERQGKHHEPLVKEFLVGVSGRQAMDRQLLISGSSKTVHVNPHTEHLLKNYSRTRCSGMCL